MRQWRVRRRPMAEWSPDSGELARTIHQEDSAASAARHMRAIIYVWLTALVLGCSNGPLPPGGDAGLTCADIPTAVQTWLESHRRCAADSDCKWVASGCALPYQC